MATIKVSEASGVVLDYLVAKCEGNLDRVTRARNFGELCKDRGGVVFTHGQVYTPSTNWAQGGPIIDREGITVIRADDEYLDDELLSSKWVRVWAATIGQQPENTVYGSQGDNFGAAYTVDVGGVVTGGTPLIAAMRCYVASKLGDVVEIPAELLKEKI